MIKQILLLLLFILVCISCKNQNNDEENHIVKIGYIGEFDISIWESLIGKLQEENIQLELIPFSGYAALNKSLNSGYIDLNHFQHYAYFVNETNKNDYYLSIVEKTFIADMNMYSENLTNISQMPKNAKIAIPEDNVNLSRALKILESIGFIKLRKNSDTNYNYSLNDVRENALNINFIPKKASDMHSIISEVDAIIINYNFNFDFQDKNVLYYDDPSKYSSDMYVKLIVCRLKEADNNIYKTISKFYKERVTKLVESGRIKGITIIN